MPRITIPDGLRIGEHFYSHDSPQDFGIYRVRLWNEKKPEEGRTHLYVDSANNEEAAGARVSELDQIAKQEGLTKSK